jgi:hypothetical protein
MKNRYFSNVTYYEQPARSRLELPLETKIKKEFLETVGSLSFLLWLSCFTLVIVTAPWFYSCFLDGNKIMCVYRNFGHETCLPRTKKRKTNI